MVRGPSEVLLLLQVVANCALLTYHSCQQSYHLSTTANTAIAEAPPRCPQSDAALFRRLCPADKAGKMSFAPVMLKRLRKLGIDKTDPAELTEEERSR